MTEAEECEICGKRCPAGSLEKKPYGATASHPDDEWRLCHECVADWQAGRDAAEERRQKRLKERSDDHR